MLSLNEIHKLEIAETYPTAIEELEQRLDAIPEEEETVIRLGFNYWLLAEQGDRINPNLPREQYASRHMALFSRYKEKLSNNADFCFAFGLGIEMFWYLLPGAKESLGRDLLRRASKLDPFYKRHIAPRGRFLWLRNRLKRYPSQEELARKFSGRGVFARYYTIISINLSFNAECFAVCELAVTC